VIMGKVKAHIVLVILGLVFAYFSNIIIGYGAAIAIPANILAPLVKSAPNFTFALVDALTIGIPIIIFYVLLVQLSKLFKVNNHDFAYAYLALPFFLLHLYYFIESFPNSGKLFYTITTIPKYILLALCVWFMSIKKPVS
jgi:hypothetical protein